jgi:SAM-dependent methyltransferase
MTEINSSVTSNHYNDSEGKRYFDWQNRYKERSGIINARKFTKYLSEKSVVVDYGCGSGELLGALLVNRKIGIEVNPHAVKSAAEKNIEVYPDLSSLKNLSIDTVISNHALEHVPFPLFSLSEIYRVLKVNGIFVCCIPVDDWRFQQEFKRSEINNHLHTWTPQLIGNLLVESGFDFENISVRLIHHSWFPGTKFVWKRKRLFDLLCFLYSKATRKGKQIIVIGRKL